MKAQQIINLALELGFENIELRNKLNEKTFEIREENAVDAVSKGVELSDLDKHCIKLGRKKLFEEIFYQYSYDVSAQKNESGEIVVTPYEKWLGDKVKEVPFDFSKNEVIKYLENILIKKYEQEKADAVTNLLKKESEGNR